MVTVCLSETGNESWSWRLGAVILRALLLQLIARVRDEQASSWTVLPEQQHSACCRPTCRQAYRLRERKFVFVFWHLKRIIVQRKKCRLTVGLSRISSISKDERAANLTSAPGGQRSRYATGLVPLNFCFCMHYLWVTLHKRFKPVYWIFLNFLI